MGSIANIPLQGRPPQFQDPTQQMAQMVQLADLINRSKQQQQMAPYVMEAAESEAEINRMKMAEAKRAQDERQALTDALADVKGDLLSPDLPKFAAKRGVSAGTLLSLQKEVDDSIATHSKRRIEEINLEKAKNLEIADTLDTVKDPGSLAYAVHKLVRAGHLSAGEGAQLINGPFDLPTIKQYSNLHKGASRILEESIKRQQLEASEQAEAASKATARKTGIETDILEQNLNAIKNAKPEDYESLVDQIVPPGVKENAALNSRTKAQIRFALSKPDGIKQAQEILKAAASEVRQLEIATDPRVQANKIILAGKLADARVNAGGLIPKEEEPGKTYTIQDVPLQIRPNVENALKYQSPLPPQSRLNPAAQATRWWTMKLDPNYSEELFSTRKKAVESMNVGKDHAKLNAMNTVLGHVGRLEEAVDALNNGDLRVLNQIANELGVATGSEAPVVFRTIVHRVGPELTQAYVGSGGEASERKEAGGDFDFNSAPGQIKASARITAKLLASKMGSTLFDFKRAARFAPDDPRGADLIEQFFTPEAIDVMDRMFPGWKTNVEPPSTTPGAKSEVKGGPSTNTAAAGGRSGNQYVKYAKDKSGTYYGWTADGKLWNVRTGREIDTTTGKEK